MNEIRFYSTSEKWACLSNFWHAPFNLDGWDWPTVEHYFQAAKTDNFEERKRVYAAKSPALAKSIGRRVTLRPNWDAIKEDVMLRALVAKFAQNLELKAVLVGTGDAELKEAAPRDYHWGIGRTGTGKNRLGILLMRVREELR